MGYNKVSCAIITVSISIVVAVAAAAHAATNQRIKQLASLTAYLLHVHFSLSTYAIDRVLNEKNQLSPNNFLTTAGYLVCCTDI